MIFFRLVARRAIKFRSGRSRLLFGAASNIAPSTDDNPFFFFTARFDDLVGMPLSAQADGLSA
jgi:hypothetical protein